MALSLFVLLFSFGALAYWIKSVIQIVAASPRKT
jgi:hypothetical protein